MIVLMLHFPKFHDLVLPGLVLRVLLLMKLLVITVHSLHFFQLDHSSVGFKSVLWRYTLLVKHSIGLALNTHVTMVEIAYGCL